MWSNYMFFTYVATTVDKFSPNSGFFEQEIAHGENLLFAEYFFH